MCRTWLGTPARVPPVATTGPGVDWTATRPTPWLPCWTAATEVEAGVLADDAVRRDGVGAGPPVDAGERGVGVQDVDGGGAHDVHCAMLTSSRAYSTTDGQKTVENTFSLS